MSRPPQTEGERGDESTARFLRLADRQLRPAYRLAGYLLGSSDEFEAWLARCLKNQLLGTRPRAVRT